MLLVRLFECDIKSIDCVIVRITGCIGIAGCSFNSMQILSHCTAVLASLQVVIEGGIMNADISIMVEVVVFSY